MSAPRPAEASLPSTDAEIPISADLAVHALAQLPDSVNVEIASSDDVARAMVVARAYGVDNRIDVRLSAGDGKHRPSARFSLDGVARPYGPGSFASLLHDIGSTTPTPTRRGDDRVLAGARIAVITNQPAHYRIPLFNGLAERLGAVDASLRVYFLERTPTARPWLEGQRPAAFDHEYLSSVALPVRRHRRPSVPSRLGSELAGFQPTIILAAGLSPFVAGRAARFARNAGVSIGVWSGEIGQAPTARGRVRRAVRRQILCGVDFAIVYGWKSAQYLHQLAPSLPVVIGRNSSSIPARILGSRIPLQPTLVAVGDLASNRKGMDVLIDALSLTPHLQCELRLIGGGRLLPELAASARTDPRVTVLGPLGAAETRAEMSRSDVYLFPTRFDLFGLSLVEAMGCGLASVVTRCSGAVEDLCAPDVNCLRVDSHEPEEWAGAITRLSDHAGLRASLGHDAAATVAARWTMDHAVDAMMAGLRLGVKPTR